MTSRDSLRRLHFINALFADLTGHDLYLAQQIQSAITTSLAEAEARPPTDPAFGRRRRPAARTALRRPAGPWVLPLGRRGIRRRRHAAVHPRECAERPQEPRALSRIHPARDQSAAGPLPAQSPLDGPAPAGVWRVARADSRPRRRPQPPQRQSEFIVYLIFLFYRRPQRKQRRMPCIPCFPKPPVLPRRSLVLPSKCIGTRAPALSTPSMSGAYPGNSSFAACRRSTRRSSRSPTKDSSRKSRRDSTFWWRIA
jgi:hypothetical protein